MRKCPRRVSGVLTIHEPSPRRTRTAHHRPTIPAALPRAASWIPIGWLGAAAAPDACRVRLADSRGPQCPGRRFTTLGMDALDGGRVEKLAHDLARLDVVDRRA